MSAKRLMLLLLLPALTGCDQASTLLGLPNPQKDAEVAAAEGKAIGGACRQGGRPLEDCFTLNPAAPKAAVFAGWREMNDYMTQNNMQVVPSQLPPPALAAPAPAPETTAAAEAPAEEESSRSRRRSAAH